MPNKEMKVQGSDTTGAK